MRRIARVSDRTLGICSHPDHPVPIKTGGTIITGNPNLKDQGLPVARLNDQVRTDCGHADFINSASGTFQNNKLIAQLNDTVGREGIYNANIITASPVTLGNPNSVKTSVEVSVVDTDKALVFDEIDIADEVADILDSRETELEDMIL